MALTTSDQFAVDIYNCIAQSIFYTLVEISNYADIFVYYTQSDKFYEIKKWAGKDFSYFVQEGNDLGEKMKNAFNGVFLKDYKYAIIIGSDIPDISKENIINSFNVLEKTDVVISPSGDGGYSLLGLKEVNNALFENIKWSTNSVLAETIQKISKEKLEYIELPPLMDIDTEQELNKWIKNSENTRLIEKIKKMGRKK